MNDKRNPSKKTRNLRWLLLLELFILLALIGGYFVFIHKGSDQKDQTKGQQENTKGNNTKDDAEEELSEEEQKAQEEQQRLQREQQDRQDLVKQADRLALGYDYDGAIDLIKTYQGSQGGYSLYTDLTSAISGYEATKGTLLLYGGEYTSATQINHIFFHSLVADDAKAFDSDYTNAGYNMYMTTIYEFNKMMQKFYDDGYVLVSIHDVAKQVKADDGTTKFVEGEIYLPKGKKPLVLSQDDVNYYAYMDGDGFASRIVVGADGKPTCEMKMDDGSMKQGAFDMVPIVDAFVEEHPDFSYKGAKGILALTGYEGALGYRTNDPDSPSYEQDQEAVKKVAKALKEDGWEFASHSWGHKNHQKLSEQALEVDAKKWKDQVEPLIGPTDIYIFPFGVDIETTVGEYSSDKFKFLKSLGFDYYCGVFKEPWMHVKKTYVRMTRRPLDGQAMLQFPERVEDLFNVADVLDPNRPARNW